jgi:flagellar motor switch protein FliN/FliY
MNTFAEIDVRRIITAALTDTFSAMLAMDIRPAAAPNAPGEGCRRMAGTLHFAGNVTGILNTQISLDFGPRTASALLGTESDQEQSGSKIRGLVAEITHIIGANLKSALNDAGRVCFLSPTWITAGSDFSIKPLNMDRFERYAFQTDEHVVIIEVGLKDQGDAEAGIDVSPPDGSGRPPAAAVQQLDSLDHRSLLAAAVLDGFNTLFALKLERVESTGPDAALDPDGLRYWSAICIAGDAAGIVSLDVGQEVCRRLKANGHAGPLEEIRGTGAIEDLLGELSHFVGINLKSTLADTGLRCALSTPSFTIGSDFRVESFHRDHLERLAFRSAQHTVWAEMSLKISERVRAAAPVGPGVHPHAMDASAPEQAVPGPSAIAAPGLSPTPNPSAPPPGSSRPEAETWRTDTPRSAPEDFGLGLLLDIPVDLTVELGRTKMPIQELLNLRPGSAVKLARLEGEPVDILANDVLIARGEVVIRQEKYGIRITQITSRAQRLKGFN